MHHCCHLTALQSGELVSESFMWIWEDPGYTYNPLKYLKRALCNPGLISVLSGNMPLEHSQAMGVDPTTQVKTLDYSNSGFGWRYRRIRGEGRETWEQMDECTTSVLPTSKGCVIFKIR